MIVADLALLLPTPCLSDPLAVGFPAGLPRGSLSLPSPPFLVRVWFWLARRRDEGRTHYLENTVSILQHVSLSVSFPADFVLPDAPEKWGIFYSIFPPIATSRSTPLPDMLSHVPTDTRLAARGTFGCRESASSVRSIRRAAARVPCGENTAADRR